MAAGRCEVCPVAAQPCSGHARAIPAHASGCLVCSRGVASGYRLVVFVSWLGGGITPDCQLAIKTRLVGGDACDFCCDNSFLDCEESVVEKIEKPSTVGISGDIVDSFICSFSKVEREKLIAIYEDIIDCIEDDYAGIPNAEIMARPEFDMQSIFSEIEKILPNYTPLLRKSFDEVGDEMHLDENEVKSIFAGMPVVSSFRPKVLINDGTLNFSYLQIAARQAGINDEHLRFWYLFLGMFVGLSLKEQQH